MSHSDSEKYGVEAGDNTPAIWSYCDFASALLTMTIGKCLFISSYWAEEINLVLFLLILIFANAIIFLSWPRWTNIHATRVFLYLFHNVADLLFFDYNRRVLFIQGELIPFMSIILFIAAIFLLGAAVYSWPIYVCVSEWKKNQKESEQKNKQTKQK
jgi:hypothetical protein